MEIYNTISGEILTGTDGRDYISNLGSNVTIEAGDGNDSVYNFRDASLTAIELDTGDNFLNNTASIVTINGGSGSDDIRNSGENVTINGSMGNNSISNSGNNTTINAGNGNNAIVNFDGASFIAIDLGDGNDSVNNNGNQVTIDVGNGDNYVRNTGDSVIIRSVSGNDSISNNGSNVTVTSSDGNDSISNGGGSVTIEAGDGDDTIINSGLNATINAGTGNDSIRNSGSNVTIDAGAGDDDITNRWDNVSIGAGSGNDTVTNSDYASLTTIDLGDGNDSAVSTSTNVTINGDAGDDYIASSVFASTSVFDGGDGNDTVYNVARYSTLLGGADNDSIYNTGSNVTIDGNLGDDIIFNNTYCTLSVIDGGDGDDSIENLSSNVTIRGNAGNDSVVNGSMGIYALQASLNVIELGDGDDYIRNYGAYSTVEGGNSADTIYNEQSASQSAIDGVAGSDVIYNYADQSTINGGSGNDSIFNGTFTYDAITDEYSVSLSSVNGGAGDDYINNYADYGTIYGGEGNDTVINYGLSFDRGKHATIDGGSGNDFISLVSSSDSIVLTYSDGDGNDTVYGYSFNNTAIQFSAGLNTTTVRSGNDLIISAIGSSVGSIILKDSFYVTTVNANIDLSDASGSIGAFIVDGTAVSNSTAFYDATFTSSVIATDIVVGSVSADHVYSLQSVTGTQNISISAGWSVNASDNDDAIEIYGSEAVINTGDGNDTLGNSASNVIIDVGADNDSIYNTGNNVTIDGGAGDESIYSFSSNSTLRGSDGDDRIINYLGASLVAIDAGNGNDYISNSSSNVTIDGGTGADSIDNGYNSSVVAIDGGAGNDTITNYSSNVTIDAGGDDDSVAIYKQDSSISHVIIDVGEGNDTVINNGVSQVTIDGGEGNDIISNRRYLYYSTDYYYASLVAINAGAGDDTISNACSDVTIDGGTGDDVISIEGGSTGINGAFSTKGGSAVIEYTSGDGNDIIYGYSDANTLRISGSSISTIMSDSDVIINIDDGSIILKDYAGTINAVGSDDQTIAFADSDTSIAPGSTLIAPNVFVDLPQSLDADVGSIIAADSYTPNDDGFYPSEFKTSLATSDAVVGTVEGNTYSALSDLSGRQFIRVLGTWLVTASDLDDSIVNYAADSTINAAAGNDTIQNSVRSAVLNAGDDDDLINNYGSLVAINADDGNDRVNNNGASVTINAGDDTVLNHGSQTNIDVGNGRNSVDNDADQVTVSSGVENDFVSNTGASVSIDVGEGINTVRSSGERVTIFAGTGNDTIGNGGSYSLIDAGDGNNTVLTSGSHSTVNGGAGSDSIYNSSTQFVRVNAGAGNDSIHNDEAVNATINAGADNDYIVNDLRSSLSVLDGDDGNDSIDNEAQGVTIIAGDGDDYVTNSGSSVMIFGGLGKDTVLSSGAASTVLGGDGTDMISVSGSNTSIDAGAGNDSIEVYGNNPKITFGDGADSLVVGENISTITFTDLNVETDSISFNRSIATKSLLSTFDADGTTLASDQITLIFKDKALTDIVNYTVDNGSARNSIDELLFKPVENPNANVNLSGASSSSGYFVINGLSATNPDTFYSASFKTSLSGTDIIVGSVTADHTYVAQSDSGRQNISSAENWSITAASDKDSIYNTGANAMLNGGAGDDTITNSDTGRYSYIIGGAGNDSILNRGRFSTIDAGEGNDYVLTDIHSDDFRDVTVFGGDGNDTLIVNDHETSLNGGDGDDIVSVQGTWNTNTLQGGRGNDTLYGSSGKNVFFYNEGDGDDLVINFANHDTIQINAEHGYSMVDDGTDIIITVGRDTTEGHITLQGASGLIADIVNGQEVNVDLNLADSDTGVFVISSNAFIGGENIFDKNASFKSAAESGDTIVGSVEGGNYTAVEGIFRQNITVNGGWNVLAASKDDNIRVTGDNAIIDSGDGTDTMIIASSVSTITFGNVNSANDTIAVERSIERNSLIPTVDTNGITLASDQINIVFADKSLDDIRNCVVNNAGVKNTVEDLIRAMPTLSNPDSFVDLSTAPDSSDGFFVVNRYGSLDAGQNYHAAPFASIIDNDVIVIGSVTADRTYVATSDTGRQVITALDTWNVTASDRNDTLNINGDNVTVDGIDGNDLIRVTGNNAVITTGDGNDRIELDSSVGRVVITDFTLESDTLKFNSTMPLHSFSCSVGSDNVTLSRGSMSIVLQGLSALEDNYIVDNNGRNTSIFHLLARPVGVNLAALSSYGNGHVVIESESVEKNAVFRSAGNTVEGDVIAGSVDSRQYTADENFSGQEITVGSNWNVIASAGDDTVSVTGGNSTVNAGAGNDIIVNIGSNVLINADDSTAVLSQLASSDLAFNADVDEGTDGDDTIYSEGNYITLNAGGGNDSIHSSGSNSYIDGGAGNDHITIAGNGSTVAGGEGNDSITVAENVTLITFADLDTAADSLTFRRSIAEGSLYTLETDNGDLALYSDSIMLVFVGKSLDDIVNYTVNNGSARNSIDDLLYHQPTLSNPDSFIDLSTVPAGTEGYFVVNKYATPDVDQTYYSASFSTSLDDDVIAVGSVTADRTYAATSNTGRQFITVNDDWLVTASTRDDAIYIGGSNVTVTGGNGADSIAFGADVESITLTDLASADSLAFVQPIALRSLDSVASGGNLTLSSDQLTLNINNKTMRAISGYLVDNAGTETSLYQLVANPIGVNLSSAGTGTGVLTVDPTSTRRNASLKSAAESTDIVIGRIDSSKVYVADESSPVQSITASSNWDVTATDGDDSIKINGSGSTVDGAAGADSIVVGNNVSTITFANFDSDDAISFDRSIAENSLESIVADDGTADGVTLRSAPITLIFDGVSLSEIASYEIGNGSARSVIRDLIATSTPGSVTGGVNAAVELTDAANGYYVVDGSSAIDSDTFYPATFKASTVGTDIVVGDVDDRNYSARDVGRQSITVTGDDWSITSSGLNDFIRTLGENITVNAGAGNDTIENTGALNVFYTGDGDDYVFNRSDDGKTKGSFTTIETGEGSDTIDSAHVDVIINGGSGADSIANYSSDVTIFAGDGNDYILNFKVPKDETITANYGHVFYGGDGYRTGAAVSIVGGEGDDTIVNYGADVTINAGSGNDVISINGGSILFTYADGDGDDTVCGFDFDSSTIQIADGLSTVSTASGNDMIINVTGSTVGSITLKDYFSSDGNINSYVDLSSVGDGAVGSFVVNGSSTRDGDYLIAEFSDAIHHNGHRYQIYSDIVDTWDAAKDYAENLGGHLAIINDEEENTALYNYMTLQGYQNAYFGLSDAEEEGTWKWVDGTVLENNTLNSHWGYDSVNHKMEPNSNNENEDYGMFYELTEAYKWNDGDFNPYYPRPFLVEWDSVDDTVVGDVSSERIYSARSELGRQSITVNDNWLVTASNLDDSIFVTGDASTINGGAGNDSISVADNVSSITFGDFDPASDVISFARQIAVGSLTSIDGNLYSDQINLTFENISDEALLNATVDNAGTANFVYELIKTIKPEASHRVQLYSWAYGFTPTGTYIADLASIDEERVLISYADGSYALVDNANGNGSVWGGDDGDDTLVGTDGFNEFFYLKGNGNDVIDNAGDNDVINLLNIGLEDIDLESFPYAIGDDSTTIKFNDGGSIKVNGTSEVGFKVAGVDCTFRVKDRQWGIK